MDVAAFIDRVQREHFAAEVKHQMTLRLLHGTVTAGQWYWWRGECFQCETRVWVDRDTGVIRGEVFHVRPRLRTLAFGEALPLYLATLLDGA